MDLKGLCAERIRLIEALEAGLLTKGGYIEACFELLSAAEGIAEPIDSVEAGILKYQYYNTLAKKALLDAEVYEYRDVRHYRALHRRAETLYRAKDQISLQMLDCVNFEGVKAYFIHMHSATLAGSIYEIVFEGYDKVVLHSRDARMRLLLKQHGCFDDAWRTSLTEQYVNTRVHG